MRGGRIWLAYHIRSELKETFVSSEQAATLEQIFFLATEVTPEATAFANVS